VFAARLSGVQRFVEDHAPIFLVGKRSRDGQRSGHSCKQRNGFCAALLLVSSRHIFRCK
jgi:hypothetical protein